MKIHKTSILSIVLFVSGCKYSNLLEVALPCIDIRKSYPEKEIVLTDIADVEYVHLSTEFEEYLFKGGISCVTENTIVVFDSSSGSILFFSRDGKPKSRFNRLGSGPEEYPSAALKSLVVYDETLDDVYVNICFFNYIMVYSHTGKFKRKIPLAGTSSFVYFDDHSLLIYDEQLLLKRIRNENYTSSQKLDSSFLRISKEDGRVLDYALIPYSDVNLTMRDVQGRGGSINSFMRMVNGTEGVYLSNPENDTIYFYGKENTVTPIICKTPLVSNFEPKVVLTGFADVGRYQLVSDFTIIANRRGPPKSIYYGHDKNTGEIFSPNISLPDYKGKHINISDINTHVVGTKMLASIYMDLYELKTAYKENRLNGKLKELVFSLNEDADNAVYAFAIFK